MTITRKNSIQDFPLMIVVMAVLIAMAACGQSDQSEQADRAGQTAQNDRTDGTVNSEKNRGARGRNDQDQSPLLHVREFDRFTLRANVSPTDFLPDAIARQYGIEPASDLVLLNVVVLENQSNGAPDTVSARVTAHHQSLTGRVENIEMRAVEAGGQLSYIGTMDASGERKFPLVIEVQPEGEDQLLRMDFEAQLEVFGDDEYE